uniref:Uncharacterized protein n=1 Tax=Cacopsylla melanoneura TaxID=428564 RepID=A0A8D9F3V1_9HEMI
MFDRVLTLKVPLIFAMAELEYESNICHADRQQIAQCRDALRKFEQATQIVSAEKDIVLSKLNYVMEELLAHTKVLKNIECSPQLTEFHGVLYKECVDRKTLNVVLSSQNSMKSYTRNAWIGSHD